MKRAPKLKTLLGVPLHAQLHKIPSLIYKSHPRDPELIVKKVIRTSGSASSPSPSKMRRNSHCWITVNTKQEQLYAALGRQYFYPESSLPNLRLDNEEQSNMIQDMIEQDRRSESHSDSGESPTIGCSQA